MTLLTGYLPLTCTTRHVSWVLPSRPVRKFMPTSQVEAHLTP
jgi:hypothetical protein